LNEQDYQRFREHGGVIDLSRRTKLRVSRTDRVRYLNGQVTANVTKLGEEQAIPACVTSAKGKLSADVFLTAGSCDSILLDADEALRESLPARLERYIVADDVVLEDVTDTYTLMHFLGPAGAGEEFARHVEAFGTSGSAIGGTPTLRRCSRADRYGTYGWDVWLEPAVAKALGRELAMARFLQLRPEMAESIRIEAGIPRWGCELTEDTLPPEAGLDRTHIDYNKGCYIGQEVISRIKSVGHVNRRLSGFISTRGGPIGAGWSVYAPGDLQKPIGELTSEAWSFGLAKQVALGYLRRGSPAGVLLARPAEGDTPPVEVTPADLPLVVHFPS
jgi:folate-binding protein YgfZ